MTTADSLTTAPADETEERPAVTVTVTRSAGSDRAVVIFIDTHGFEPDGSDNGPGLRVRINDHAAYEGVRALPAGAQPHPAAEQDWTVYVNELDHPALPTTDVRGDQLTGAHVLVGDHGGRSRVYAIEQSHALPGLLTVETEHGPLYLDPQETYRAEHLGPASNNLTQAHL